MLLIFSNQITADNQLSERYTWFQVRDYWYADYRKKIRRLLRPFMGPSWHFDVNGNCDDRRLDLPSICFQRRKEICMKVRTSYTIFTLENCCCRARSRSRYREPHVWVQFTIPTQGYRCTDCKHLVYTRFFSCFFFLGEKVTARCIDVVHQCQLVRSQNDTESIKMEWFIIVKFIAKSNCTRNINIELASWRRESENTEPADYPDEQRIHASFAHEAPG